MRQKLIRFDWALKKLLRNKANFDILEGFLSELLKEDIRIIKILESESNKDTRDDKSNRVDMLVEDSRGELIIVEVQSETEWDYLQRILYGASKLLIENMREGMPYSDIKKIISVSIVYFDLGHGKDYVYTGSTNFIGLHYNDLLELNEKQKLLYKAESISSVFPEYYVLKVNQFDDIARNTLDEWIYFLKNEEIKDSFKAKGLDKAISTFDVMKLNLEDRKKYQRYLENLSYEASVSESNYGLGKLEGIEQGKLEGIEQGMNKKAIEIALSLMDLLDIETISKKTGLTVEQITKMKNQK